MPKTICIIDDEPGIRSEVSAWLEDHGFNVITAASGDEAFEKMGQQMPHLVLLDIIMPRTDGLEVLSRIKNNESTAKLPVIMLTAKKEAGTILRAQSFRADDYFFKPFNPDELLRSIRKYV